MAPTVQRKSSCGCAMAVPTDEPPARCTMASGSPCATRNAFRLLAVISPFIQSRIPCCRASVCGHAPCPSPPTISPRLAHSSASRCPMNPRAPVIHVVPAAVMDASRQTNRAGLAGCRSCPGSVEPATRRTGYRGRRRARLPAGHQQVPGAVRFRFAVGRPYKDAS